jgi:hypothetical protein
LVRIWPEGAGTLVQLVAAGASKPKGPQKILQKFLAKNYNFVMMDETYEENIPFCAIGRVHPVDRMRMSDISCR